MLKQLLALLERGGTWRVTDLATALGTSPEMVSMMLSYLAQNGKIDIPERVCAKTCAGCSLESACRTEPSGHTFTYTGSAPKSPGGSKAG